MNKYQAVGKKLGNKVGNVTVVILITVLSFNSEFAFADQEKLTGYQLNDPTRPIGVLIKQSTESKKQASITLNAIFNRGSDSSAIINGQLLRVGDSYAGMRVLNISKDRVVLLNNNEQLVLSMYPSIVKQSKSLGEAQ